MSRCSEDEVSATTGIGVELRVTSDLAEYFDAIDPRQLEVEQDEARAFHVGAVRVLAAGKEEVPGPPPVLDGDDVVDEPPLRQGPDRELAVLGAVLDEQDVRRFNCHNSSPCGGRAG